MAGHSKFANIKHKKAKNDAAKAKIFTKLGKEIMVACKQGGADPNTNSTLRDVIYKAKSNNMPNDNIDRLLKKASGDTNSDSFEHITYEGYGPNGVAVIVTALTDNRNRAAANVRNAFTKGGGNMGTTGSVSFMFDEKGFIHILKEVVSEEIIMDIALNNGASDFEVFDEHYEITTEVFEHSNVLMALEKENIEVFANEVGFFPQTTVLLTSEEDKKKMIKLLTLLENDDDVQDIYHNLEVELDY